MTLIDLVATKASRDELVELLRATEAQRLQLLAAIRWALGEGDSDFGNHIPDNKRPFWWRKELRRRAGLFAGNYEVPSDQQVTTPPPAP